MRVQGLATLVIVGLAGCGRIAFDDAGSDGGAGITGDVRVCVAPVGHDEDGDLVDDACDVCPHIADAAQPDVDGDGVGDACDPRPSTPGDTITFFDAFTAAGVWNGVNATIDATGAHLSAFGGFASLQRPLVDGTYQFTIGGTVVQGATPSHHLQILLYQSGAQNSYYCELYSEPGVYNSLSWTYSVDGGATFPSDMSAVRANGLVGTQGTLQLNMDATSGGCAATWGGESSAATGSRHGIVPDTFELSAKDLDATIAYVIAVRSN